MIFGSNLFARLLTLVIAATLPAVLVLVYLQQELRGDRMARIPDEALQQAELINADMRSVMEGARQLSAAMARFLTVRTLNPSCGTHMVEVQDDLPSYTVVSVRDSNGRIVCSSNAELASDTMDQHCFLPGAHLAAGEVQTGVEGLPSLVGQIKAGAIVPLAVTSIKRSPQLPEVPAMSEFIPGFDATAWIVLMAPAATPASVVSRIAAEVKKALDDPGVRQQLEAQGATVIGSSPLDTTGFLRGELSKFKRAVEISGAKAE